MWIHGMFFPLREEADEGGDKGTTEIPEPKTPETAEPKVKPDNAVHELYAEVKDTKAKLAAAKADLKAKDDAIAKAEARIAEYGTDPEKVKALIKAEKDREEAALLEAQEFDKLKNQTKQEAEDRIAAIKEASDAKIADLEAKLEKQNASTKELTETQKYSNSKYINEELNLTPTRVRKLWGDHFTENDEGEMIAYNKPEGESGRRPLVDSEGEYLGFEAAIEKIVGMDPNADDFKKSKVKQGGNSGASQNKSKSTKPKTKLKGVDRMIALKKAEQEAA